MDSVGRLEYSLSRDTINSSSLDRIVGLLRVELIGDLLDPLNGFLTRKLISMSGRQ
jgi:hypothetical protein